MQSPCRTSSPCSRRTLTRRKRWWRGSPAISRASTNPVRSVPIAPSTPRLSPRPRRATRRFSGSSMRWRGGCSSPNGDYIAVVPALAGPMITGRQSLVPVFETTIIIGFELPCCRVVACQPFHNLSCGNRAARECRCNARMRWIGNVARRKRAAARCFHVAVDDEVPARVGGEGKLDQPSLVRVRLVPEQQHHVIGFNFAATVEPNLDSRTSVVECLDRAAGYHLHQPGYLI